MSGSSSSQRQQPSLLDQVLPTLRPFQREAYEFAAQGTVHARQWLSSSAVAAAAAAAGRDNDNATSVAVAASSTINNNNNEESNSNPRRHDDPTIRGKGRVLIADEMGLGKTVTSLAIMAHYEHEWPLLIICPASLRYTWPSEIEKFLPGLPPRSVYVVQGFHDVAFTKRKDVRVVVATYSLFQARSAVSKVIPDMDFRCVIVDESHNLKEKKSQRSKLIMPVLTRSKRLVLLSGTPALAKPAELWTQMACLAPKLVGNWTKFTNRYCNPRRKYFGGRVVWDYDGSSNEMELHAKLKNIMVRRLKVDVLDELPPKQRSIVPVTMKSGSDEKKECQLIMKELKEMRASFDQLVGEEARNADFAARSKLTKAYEATGKGKAPQVAEYLIDWLTGSASTEKILVFCHHQVVMDCLDKALLAKYPNRHIRIDGKVQTNIRSQLVKKFQTCARVRVALLSMTAAGVGLTLTAASTVLFAELNWTPGVLGQAEDRAHRIGQRSTVQIVYMVCKDETVSVDMSLWKLLGRKIDTLGQVVDGRKETPYLYQAQESPSKPKQANAASQGQTVQDELISFFAETSAAEKSRKRSSIPAKGSIESFFKKANTKKTPTQCQGKGATTSSSTQKNSNQKLTKGPSSAASNLKKAPQAKKPSSSVVKWACDVCTFDNSSEKPKDKEWLPCSMCGNLYHAETVSVAGLKPSAADETSSNVSRITNSRKRKSGDDDNRVWVCTTCTFENRKPKSTNDRYTCEMCRGSSTLAKSSFLDEAETSDEDDDDLLKPVFSRKSQRTEPIPAARDQRPARVSLASGTKVKTPRPSRVSVLTPSDVIVLDGADDEPVTNNAADAEIIVVDSDDEAKPAAEPPSAKRIEDLPVDTHTLTFSVSKNSGRITIHKATSGASSLINFAIDDVVDSETADRLLDERVKKRSLARPGSVQIGFDPKGLRGLVDRLNLPVLGSTRLLNPPPEEDIKAFVRSYLALTEVGKKALKDSGRVFSAAKLSQSVAGLITPSFTGTERYGGGARERALANMKEGNETAADTAVICGEACAWCGGTLSSAVRQSKLIYCSQACKDQGSIRSSSTEIRSALFALEGGKCQLCRLDAHSLFEQTRALQPSERLNKLLSSNWKLPAGKGALDKLLQDPREGDFWQVDHIVAVAEGGGGCGIDNLRTLCTPCHRLETEKLRGRLKLMDRSTNSSTDDGTMASGKRKQQTDIRSAFAPNKK